ncbi:unnamed protein product [Cyprideis torosa]|uniref:Uncharacterized protein n=1 Tax=Cyprideis torosa TaxID=163714 RepID=A0A7R8WIS7_9CRUS|nr:unnamed protein product [Cyprideis torosa]CAG0898305.1 unnamed protein product [Cyprideis torosa]
MRLSFVLVILLALQFQTTNSTNKIIISDAEADLAKSKIKHVGKTEEPREAPPSTAKEATEGKTSNTETTSTKNTAPTKETTSTQGTSTNRPKSLTGLDVLKYVEGKAAKKKLPIFASRAAAEGCRRCLVNPGEVCDQVPIKCRDPNEICVAVSAPDSKVSACSGDPIWKKIGLKDFVANIPEGKCVSETVGGKDVHGCAGEDSWEKVCDCQSNDIWETLHQKDFVRQIVTDGKCITQNGTEGCLGDKLCEKEPPKQCISCLAHANDPCSNTTVSCRRNSEQCIVVHDPTLKACHCSGNRIWHKNGFEDIVDKLIAMDISSGTQCIKENVQGREVDACVGDTYVCHTDPTEDLSITTTTPTPATCPACATKTCPPIKEPPPTSPPPVFIVPPPENTTTEKDLECDDLLPLILIILLLFGDDAVHIYRKDEILELDNSYKYSLQAHTELRRLVLDHSVCCESPENFLKRMSFLVMPSLPRGKGEEENEEEYLNAYSTILCYHRAGMVAHSVGRATAELPVVDSLRTGAPGWERILVQSLPPILTTPDFADPVTHLYAARIRDFTCCIPNYPQKTYEALFHEIVDQKTIPVKNPATGELEAPEISISDLAILLEEGAGLEPSMARRLAALSDLTGNWSVDAGEFCTCLHMCQLARHGLDIPTTLPVRFVPKIERHKLQNNVLKLKGEDTQIVPSTEVPTLEAITKAPEPTDCAKVKFGTETYKRIREVLEVSDTDPTPPEKKVGDKAPERKVGDKAPERKVGDTAPEKKFSDTAPERKVSDTAPERKVGDTAPERKVSDTAPDRKVSDTAPERKHRSSTLEGKEPTEIERNTLGRKGSSNEQMSQNAKLAFTNTKKQIPIYKINKGVK